MDNIISEHFSYPATNANIESYIARPKTDKRLPAVIIIHEIFGLDPHFEDVARRFANAGYVALAPDLFSRPNMPVSKAEIAKGMQFMMSIPVEKQRDPNAQKEALDKLSASDKAAVQKTMEWLMHRDYTQNLNDLKSAFNWLSDQNFVNQKNIASIGFCMGGTLSGRLAAEGVPLGAAVILYGENPPAEKIPNIKCPILGLYGGEDHRITGEVPQLENEMKKANKAFEYRIYKGAHHAFFNDTRPHHNKEASQEAWKEIMSFFAANLNKS